MKFNVYEIAMDNGERYLVGSTVLPNDIENYLNTSKHISGELLVKDKEDRYGCCGSFTIRTDLIRTTQYLENVEEL